MATTTSMKGITVAFSNTPQAKDDLYSYTESVESSIQYLDVMANDLGGNAKSLYAIDDGRNADGSADGSRTSDLLQQDAVNAVGTSALGATIWITSDGKIAYDASSLGDLDYLAQGQHLTDNFTYAIRLANGTIGWATATVDIVGQNDPIVITAQDLIGGVTEQVTPAGNLIDSGGISFTDLDLTDVHLVSATGTPVGTVLGTLTAVVNGDTTGTGAGGQLTWTYTVADSAVEYLAKDQTKVESFTITLNDQHGSIITKQIDVTITGTNDAPVAVADTNALDAVVEAGVTPGAPINPANGLAGTWLGNGSDFSALTLFADGRYMFMEGSGQPPNGGEAGTWVYDASAGKIALHNTFDGNIGGGLAPDQNDIFNPVTFNAAQIALTIFNPDVNATVTLTGTRQPVSTGIAGTWLNTPAPGEPFTALMLFEDHRFMYMEGGGLPPNGLEAGTYSYDPLSGALRFFTTFDSNNDGTGTGGLSPTLDHTTLTAIVNGDTLSVSGAPTEFLPLHRQFSIPANPAIDSPFAGDATAVGNVFANDTDVDVGAILTVSEVNGLAGNVGATIVGAYGSVVIGNDGRYVYTLDNADPDTNALAQGASANDVFTYTVTDEFGASSSSTLTIGITGTNDAPVAVADSNAGDAVVESGVNPDGTPFAGDTTAVGNVLTNDTDVDTGDVMTVTSIGRFTGVYGTLTLGALGKYTYVLNNADPDTNVLAQNAHAQDVFHYTMRDAAGAISESTLTIAITGTNDAAVLSSAVVAVTEGDTAAAIGASGHLTISDVDSPVTFHAQANTAGHYGAFSIDAGGAWAYAADSAHNEFVNGTMYHDAFDVVSADGTHTSVTVNILGTDDAPVVTAPVTLTAIAEDSGARLITQAELLAHATDVDGPNSLAATGLAISSGHGVLADHGDGTWSYTPALNDDTAVTFSYGVTDGIAPAVAASATLDITPVNDAATIMGVATGSVTEDGTLTAGGILTVADVDTGENHFQTPGLLSGIYGDFTFDVASGVWGYTLNNGATNVQALNATDVVQDRLTVTSSDGTASQDISVMIAGAAEAPAGIGRALAVAYDDRDGNNIYDAAGDTLYFGVFDTNGDNTFSAGDTLRADFYPADVTASEVFEFKNKDHVITEADWFPASHGLLVFAGAELVGFAKSDVGETVSNSTIENYFNGGHGLGLTDLIDWPYPTGPLASADAVGIEAGWATDSTLMPTGPLTAVNSQLYQDGNQHWLNVDFLV